MKRLILFGLLLSLWSGLAEAARPNVVIFYADDFGWGDLAVNGGKIPTPNMDRIFNKGIRFDNYTTHCVCSPSRGGLLTGRHYININAGPVTGGELDLDEITMAESFKAAGYATGAFGKWHNGAPTSYGPDPSEETQKKYTLGNGANAHGFDRFVGYYGGGGNFFTRYANVYQHNAWYHDRENRPDEEGYTTDLITKYALEFIAENKGGPFFCYIPHEAMHNPLHAKYIDILRVPESVRKGTPLLSEEEYMTIFLKHNGWTKMPHEQKQIVRAAMLMSLDDAVGEVLQYLEDENLFDNTIILFASDNGATPDGNNLPLRGKKHTLYEGGIRVPAAMWWKDGGLEGGGAYNGDFGFLDVYPTLCSLTGIDRLPGRPLDGEDLSQAIRSGEDNEARAQHWVWRKEGVTRMGRWKLIYNLEEMQLYDLENDLSETTNLADTNPEMVQTLKAKHEKWLKQVNCNPSYAVPQVDADVKPAPEGEVLEFYSEQVSGVPNIGKGLRFIFALGYGDEELEPVLPGDVIEYDIMVADDGQNDGFLYTYSIGWTPHLLSGTGYDQYGRLQSRAPGVKAGKGAWEHRIVGVGNACPGRMPFNMMCLGGKDPGVHHFYIDNLKVRRADGRVENLWSGSKDTFTRWDEEPFMITPNHKAFKNTRVEPIELGDIRKR